jgi:hypothetical protein
MARLVKPANIAHHIRLPHLRQRFHVEQNMYMCECTCIIVQGGMWAVWNQHRKTFGETVQPRAVGWAGASRSSQITEEAS